MATLADRLAELVNPAPRDLDPEQRELGKPKVAPREASAPDDDVIPPEQRLARNRTSLRARADAESLEQAYKGKVVSRAELFGDGGAFAGGSDEDLDEDEEEEGDIAAADAEGEEEEAEEDDDSLTAAALRMLGKGTGRAAKAAPKQKGKKAKVVPMDEDENEEEEEEEGDEDEGEEEDDEDEEEEMQNVFSSILAGSDIAAAQQEEVERELAALADEERQQQLLQRRSVTEEMEKAKHVKSQRSIWESLVHVRIRLQQAMLHAHRLPQPGAFELFTGKIPVGSNKSQPKPSSAAATAPSKTQSAILAKYRAAQRSVEGLLADLSELTHALAENNASGMPQDLLQLRLELPDPAAAAAEEVEQKKSAKKQRKEKERPLSRAEEEKNRAERVKAAEQYVGSLMEVQRPWYEQVIDKWNKRTQQASGSSVMAAKQFKALDQSVVTQIRNILADEETLIKRSQLKRTPFKVIGKPSKPGQQQQQQQVPTSSSFVQPQQEEYEEEHYDDTDFYQALLRDIIAMGSGAGADDELLQTAKLARKKTQKQVDRRASKGRKIRYVVIPKLVGYMAPKPQLEDDNVIDSLFASLFGKTPGAAEAEGQGQQQTEQQQQ